MRHCPFHVGWHARGTKKVCMRDDFENLQLWHSPEVNLVHAVKERGIAVQLVFAPRRSGESVCVVGHFVQIQESILRLAIAEDGEQLAEALQGGPLGTPLPCEVVFRIDYGLFADDAIMPGEYAAMGEIVGMGQQENDGPGFFDLRVSHRFTRRKTRRFERSTWNPAADSLVRLLVVRGEPANRQELGPLLFEAMHEKDKSHDLVDISTGGAYINVETQMAVRPLHMGEYYLMLLLPDRHDRAMLPFVFLAKKIAVVQGGADANKSALRLHFVSELNWKESTRDRLAWQDIRESGSLDLGAILAC